MNSFLLEIDASSVFVGTAPTLQILLDGVVVAEELINSSRSLSYDLDFIGNSFGYPGSVSFRFVDDSGETKRGITLDNVRVNGVDVDTKSVNAKGNIKRNTPDDLLGQNETVALDIKDAAIQNAFDTLPPLSPAAITATWDPEDGPTAGDLDTPTVVGTNGDDDISGVPGLLTIDIIDGGAGDDLIHGETGDDQLIGGTGNDVIYGNDGDDVAIGGDGNDRLEGQDGDDHLYGNDGDDRVYGQEGDDVVSGNAGEDIVYGGEGNDTVYGGDDNDRLYGDNGNDTLYGGAGGDRLYGGAGTNELHGGDGADLLWGGTENDTLYGDGGDDRLRGGGGTDTLFGGDGNDNVKGGSGTDTLFGEAGDDVLAGYEGNDSLDGGAGNDKLYGHEGNDTITGGAGDDFILAHTGTDIVDGGDGNDEIYTQDGADTLNGGNDDDIINGGNDGDTLNGDAGNDTVIGGAGADTINGGAGDDILHGHGIQNNEANQLVLADPSIVYNAQTNSFYRYVTTNVNYLTAQAAAENSILSGVSGHLVNITSQAEQDFVFNLTQTDTSTNFAWIGGNDLSTEGEWRWEGGAEAGIQFWDGNQNGEAVNNQYTNFHGTNPQGGTGENAGIIVVNAPGFDSFWADQSETTTNYYVIEWDAGLIADDNAVDILNGGAGNDQIYGYGGNDILSGDADNDLIIGHAGSDTINGGTGNDILYAFDGSVEIGAVGSAGASVTLIDEAFGADTGVFSYTDGGFGGSDGGGVTVTGSRDTGDGDAANGSLEVFIDRTGTFTNASGSWNTSVSHAADLSNTQLTLSYRHTHDARNDNGEDSEVYIEFNGVTYDASGGSSFISQALGSGGETDTGWITVTIDLPDLTAGTTYNLSLGILHSGANRNREDALVRFDDITLTGDEASGAGPSSTNNADIGESNTINGGSGNDIIYGSAGSDILNGDAGVDIIYSASANEAWDAAVAGILANNAGIVYSEETNSFYQVVNSTVDWTVANAAANASMLTGLSGVNGHLATITSAAEQNFAESIVGGTSTWLGGGDFGTEGVWTWTAGPEAGAQFASASGASVNGWYTNWSPGQPNDSNGTQDYLYLLNGTDWADLVVEGDGSTGFVDVDQYLIEWEADSLIASVDSSTINGGSGNDVLYANDGIDTFVYDSATWSGAADADTIENFSAIGRDAIDISNLLSGYDYLNDDIADFVSLSESGGNTTVIVDTDGVGGAASASVAILSSVTGLDLYELIAGDNLII